MKKMSSVSLRFMFCFNESKTMTKESLLVRCKISQLSATSRLEFSVSHWDLPFDSASCAAYMSSTNQPLEMTSEKANQVVHFDFNTGTVSIRSYIKDQIFHISMQKYRFC